MMDRFNKNKIVFKNRSRRNQSVTLLHV